MSYGRRHRERCSTTQPETLVQTTLVVGGSRLSYAPLTCKRPHPRTPAPNAVRRIANIAVFTTSDPSLTSFLRFPAEIRIAIYRLLLRAGHIYYFICFAVRRFVVWSREDWLTKKYPWARHGLFPAILECCRTTYAEGCEVLYGENRFDLGCSDLDIRRRRYAWSEPFHSWPLSRRCLDYITHGTLRPGLADGDALLAAEVGLLPKLGRLDMCVQMSGEQWEAFLRRTADALLRIPKLDLEIRVPEREVWDICRRLEHLGSAWSPMDDEVECKRTYLLVMDRYPRLTEGRRLTWRFVDMTSSLDGHIDWRIYLSLE